LCLEKEHAKPTLNVLDQIPSVWLLVIDLVNWGKDGMEGLDATEVIFPPSGGKLGQGLLLAIVGPELPNQAPWPLQRVAEYKPRLLDVTSLWHGAKVAKPVPKGRALAVAISYVFKTANKTHTGDPACMECLPT
jgi:hypothetical protein